MSKILHRAAKAKKDLENEEEDEFIVVKKKSSKKSTSVKKVPAVDGSHIIYLGHIPHGFYEKEMRRFFRQFGEVNQVKLFRSKKTENSKGYGFVEFDTPETAAVVAEAMNGYFLHGKQLVCNVVTKDKVHDGMFKPPKRKSAQTEVIEDAGDAEEKLRIRAMKVVEALSKKKQRLELLGIDFKIPDPVVEEESL